LSGRAMRAWLPFQAFCSHCRELGFPLKMPTFVSENPDALLERAKHAHQRQREEVLGRGTQGKSFAAILRRNCTKTTGPATHAAGAEPTTDSSMPEPGPKFLARGSRGFMAGTAVPIAREHSRGTAQFVVGFIQRILQRGRICAGPRRSFHHPGTFWLSRS